MVGCYFMAMKRLAEFRDIGAQRAAAYRKSFASTRERLLVSIMFYASSAMLFLGAFIMRYRSRADPGLPAGGARDGHLPVDGPAREQRRPAPELLYRERSFVAATALCAAVLTLCMFVDASFLGDWFAPTAPTDPITHS